jgi:hypothetical protein
MYVQVFAQSNEPTFNASVDKSTLLIGDEIKLTLTSSFNTQDNFVQFSLITDSLENIEIVKKSKIDTSFDKLKTYLKQQISLTSFDSGKHIIPSLSATIKSKKGGTDYVLNTSPITLQVQMPVVDTSKPPMPIFDIIEAKQPMWLIALYIVLGLLFLIGIYIAYKKYKQAKLNKKPIYETPKIIIPPHTLALQKIETIQQQQDWLSENEKKYHTELTDTLREYIHAQFGIDTFEMTSDEIIKLCKKNIFLKKHISDLQYLLSTADMVKFAKSKPSTEEHELCIKKTKQLITESNHAFAIAEEKRINQLKNTTKK